MRVQTVCLSIIFILLSAAQVDAAEGHTYRHPDLPLEFSAGPGWRRHLRPGDPGTLEMIDPVTGIHVLLWHTRTEQSASRYLSKMTGMMDVQVDGDPVPRVIDGRQAWVHDLAGTVAGSAVRTLLAVVPGGGSVRHFRESDLYLVQIWCPLAQHASQAGTMERLLDSVRITDGFTAQDRIGPVYPETAAERPDLPSPLRSAAGREYVIARTAGGEYTLVDVTLENTGPQDYAERRWNKGDQLVVDEQDFPFLARTGRHDQAELAGVRTITGRPVAEITADGQPGAASGAGFLAAGQELIAVLDADNRLVARLGLTHPELARPLFHVFNLVLADQDLFRIEQVPWHNLVAFHYNDHLIELRASGAKGWQESIFADGVLGYYAFTLRREPTAAETAFLRERYGHLEEAEFAELRNRLTFIHTGEMVPFYIMRYGFYEGHTSYRADPVAIASVFGLLSLPQIDAALTGELGAVLIGKGSSPTRQ
jgi:hypothetical protein